MSLLPWSGTAPSSHTQPNDTDSIVRAERFSFGVAKVGPRLAMYHTAVAAEPAVPPKMLIKEIIYEVR